MSWTKPIGWPPLAVRLALAILLFGAAAALLAVPKSWHSASWAAPMIVGLLGLQLIIWPAIISASQPYRGRAFGGLMLAISAFMLISQFLSE